MPYLLLTDTDNVSFLFAFVCHLNCLITEEHSRDIIFEILLITKIRERLDLSANYFTEFNAQGISLKKQAGLYKIEAIDNSTMITIVINLK